MVYDATNDDRGQARRGSSDRRAAGSEDGAELCSATERELRCNSLTGTTMQAALCRFRISEAAPLNSREATERGRRHSGGDPGMTFARLGCDHVEFQAFRRRLVVEAHAERDGRRWRRPRPLLSPLAAGHVVAPAKAVAHPLDEPVRMSCVLRWIARSFTVSRRLRSTRFAMLDVRAAVQLVEIARDLDGLGVHPGPRPTRSRA